MPNNGIYDPSLLALLGQDISQSSTTIEERHQWLEQQGRTIGTLELQDVQLSEGKSVK